MTTPFVSPPPPMPAQKVRTPRVRPSDRRRVRPRPTVPALTQIQRWLDLSG